MWAITHIEQPVDQAAEGKAAKPGLGDAPLSDLPEDERLIGVLLRRQREARGLTLNAIALRTKIRSGLLEALEAGRYDRLPGEAYVKGFIRCYARALEIDDRWILDRYHELQTNRLADAQVPDAAVRAGGQARRDIVRRFFASLNAGLNWFGL